MAHQPHLAPLRSVGDPYLPESPPLARASSAAAAATIAAAATFSRLMHALQWQIVLAFSTVGQAEVRAQECAAAANCWSGHTIPAFIFLGGIEAMTMVPGPVSFVLYIPDPPQHIITQPPTGTTSIATVFS